MKTRSQSYVTLFAITLASTLLTTFSSGAPGVSERLLTISGAFPQQNGPWGRPPGSRQIHNFGPVEVPRSGRLVFTVTGTPNVRQEVQNLTREDSRVERITFNGTEINLPSEFPVCNPYGSNPAICTSKWDAPGAGTLSGEILQSAVFNTWGEFSSPAQSYELAVDFIPGPDVTGISPSSGSKGGHTPVTITGDGFAPNAVVLFNEVAGTNFVVVSPQQITCTTPPGWSAANVRVLNPDFDITESQRGLPYEYGRPWGLFGTLPGGYTYTDAAPTPAGPLDTEMLLLVTDGYCEEQDHYNNDPDTERQSSAPIPFNIPGEGRLRFETYAFIPITGPVYGPEGDPMNFEAYNDSSTVHSYTGSNAMSYLTSRECTQIGTIYDVDTNQYIGRPYDAIICQATSDVPAAATGPSEFIVTGPARISAAFGDFISAPFQKWSTGVYFAHKPVITSVSPAFGDAGTQITISGTYFGTDTSVTIGGELASIVQIPNTQTIICTAPANVSVPGPVDVSVQVLGMTTTLEDGFTYGAGGGNSDADPDPDLVEIYVGQDPYVTEGEQALTPMPPSGGQAKVRFNRVKNTTLTGTIRWSTDLTSWREDNVSLSVVQDLGDKERIEISIPHSAGGRIFIVLQVE